MNPSETSFKFECQKDEYISGYRQLGFLQKSYTGLEQCNSINQPEIVEEGRRRRLQGEDDVTIVDLSCEECLAQDYEFCQESTFEEAGVCRSTP